MSTEPKLVNARELTNNAIGSMLWDEAHNPELLTVTNDGLAIEWGPRKPEYKGEHYPPAWAPAKTHAQLHSGFFSWDFNVEEMASRQIGVGFMLVWDQGLDWGFFGYLGAGETAWELSLIHISEPT